MAQMRLEVQSKKNRGAVNGEKYVYGAMSQKGVGTTALTNPNPTNPYSNHCPN